DDPSNRIPFTAPEGYDPGQYEAHARLAEALRQGGLDLAQHEFVTVPIAYSRDRAHYKYNLNGLDESRRARSLTKSHVRRLHPSNGKPYPISYRSLIPMAQDAVNFVNSVTLSATH